MKKNTGGIPENGSSFPVALITGAAGGLGEKIAAALSGGGYRVAVNYLHAEKKAAEVAERAGRGSFAVRADVGDLKQVGEMMARIENTFGRLDAVINNAGITRDALLIRQSEMEWDEVISSNLKGCFNVIKCAAPLMIKSGGGHIINISSRSGARGKPGQASYSASKAAILGLTYTAAAELAEYRIRVNALLPGYMPVGLGINTPAAMEEARERSILKKLASPLEAAQFVATLLGTENITGQVFSLDSRTV